MSILQNIPRRAATLSAYRGTPNNNSMTPSCCARVRVRACVRACCQWLCASKLVCFVGWTSRKLQPVIDRPTVCPCEWRGWSQPEFQGDLLQCWARMQCFPGMITVSCIDDWYIYFPEWLYLIVYILLTTRTSLRFFFTAYFVQKLLRIYQSSKRHVMI